MEDKKKKKEDKKKREASQKVYNIHFWIYIHALICSSKQNCLVFDPVSWPIESQSHTVLAVF